MDQLKTKLVSWLEEHLQLKKFRPPANIRFIIRPEFIKEGDPVNSEEFKLMTILCDYSEVTDIYENSSMLEFEITKHLMNLRKKNAIKIIAKD